MLAIESDSAFASSASALSEDAASLESADALESAPAVSTSLFTVAMESSVTVTDLNAGTFLITSFNSAIISSCDCSDAAEAEAEADAELDPLADDAGWLLHPAITPAANAATSAAETHIAIRFIKPPFPSIQQRAQYTRCFCS